MLTTLPFPFCFILDLLEELIKPMIWYPKTYWNWNWWHDWQLGFLNICEFEWFSRVVTALITALKIHRLCIFIAHLLPIIHIPHLFYGIDIHILHYRENLKMRVTTYLCPHLVLTSMWWKTQHVNTSYPSLFFNRELDISHRRNLVDDNMWWLVLLWINSNYSQ